MRNKKILTIEDLVAFCEQKNFVRFTSKESGYDLCVQVPAHFEEEKEESDDSILYAKVKAFHTGANRNKSSLTEKAAKECMKNMAYKPVLANFCEVDGVKDFTAHDMEFNDDGTVTYLEKQVGCFTADKPYLEADPDNPDRKYVYAKVAIPREYTDAAEIIERKGGTKVSVELKVSDLSYDSAEHLLMLNAVEVTGLTLLGLNPDSGEEVQEGMQGARLDIQDFSLENNSVANRANLIEEITAEVLNRLDYKKADFSAEETTERRNDEVDHFKNKEVTEETEVTEVMEEATEEETPVVETEASKEVADEETAEVTPEVVEEYADEDPATDGDNEGLEDASDGESGTTEEDPTEEPTEDPTENPEETEEEKQSVSAIEDEDSTGTRVENSLTYSVTIDGVTKEFSVSLREKLNALGQLFNETYCEADGVFYDVDVYDEEKYLVAHDWWGDKHYKQSYTVKKDVYSLKGDRIQVYAQYLTADQIAQLDKMKADFEAVSDELSQYKEKELHAQREAVLNSEDYAVMADFAEFNELKESMDNYSVEELTEKADLVYAKFMKSNYSNFATKETKEKNVVFMATGEKSEEERLPYGGLFKNFKSKR